MSGICLDDPLTQTEMSALRQDLESPNSVFNTSRHAVQNDLALGRTRAVC